MKELEDELLKLRIENAFLKELRRLRLEDEAKMRDLPESSVASEDDLIQTFHSDQGWAYQTKSYSNRLKKEHIFQSMSRKGNCYDNSVMENFFGLLKQEIYYGVMY